MVWFAVWPFGWKLKPSQTQFKLQTFSIFRLEFFVDMTSILPIIVLMLQQFAELGAPGVFKKKASFQQICHSSLNSDWIALIFGSLNSPCKSAGDHHFGSFKYVPCSFVSKTA